MQPTNLNVLQTNRHLKKHKWNDLNRGSDLDKRIADDFPLLLRVGRHVQGLADAFPWRPVLLGDGEGCRPVVESVSCIHHCKEGKSVNENLF